MKAVLQRVRRAKVTCESGKTARIGRGYLILLGVSRDDEIADVQWLTQKIPHIRLFPDADGVMNHSLLALMQEAMTPTEETGVLLISQFTLHADTRKGRRPHYGFAARPDVAIPLYEALRDGLRQSGLHVETGVFGDHMDIDLVADGPVTILLDTRD
jgi:D-aminoacyl-tRNA deacylase